MKKILLLALLYSGGVLAQDQLAQAAMETALARTQEHTLQLAEAFDEGLYPWRPSEGIMSVAEVLTHVAASNYYLATKMGFPPPADARVMELRELREKEAIVSALKRSSAFVLEVVGKVTDGELDTEVDFGFAKMNTMGGLLRLIEHNAEHKGQLIAYARSNGIQPPWSR
ncbi:DinB family protein [Maribacter sp. 2307ULW6-5]|uniref:DinB family protein n=1 Tax=Maribacter sp. 2307ULW6-5 TaxID=3386275 RepID=UPI0039BCF547